MARLFLLLIMTVALAAPAVPAQAREQPSVLLLNGDDPETGSLHAYAQQRLEMEGRRWGFSVETSGETLHHFNAVIAFDTPDLSPGHWDELTAYAEGGGSLLVVAATDNGYPGIDIEPNDQFGNHNATMSITGVAEDFFDTESEMELKAPPDYLKLNDDDPETTHQTLITAGNSHESRPVAGLDDQSTTMVTTLGSAFDHWENRDFLTFVRHSLTWATADMSLAVESRPDSDTSWPFHMFFGLVLGALAIGGLNAVVRMEKQENEGETRQAGSPSSP
ncbi:hypothetical protein [Haloglycomyces albus]|uniref:hypothetical protein n=1 Tax=Haloglycomyces albus TaxID=526067 RepID=UPI00046C9F92|nr:hypothetical protein [Haloglycomyces albus]